ncbi:MAG: hypothetical protein ACPG19_11750 [Saprospiraceae bacterium]
MNINKNILFIILFLFGSIQIVIAQTYLNPPFKSKTNPRVSIYKIETTTKATIVYFKYKSNFKGGTRATACINPDMYIQDTRTGKKYIMQKAVNIPYCPKSRVFYKENYQFKFKIYFKRLPHQTDTIDVIEHILGGSAFNFSRVFLQPIA